MNAAEIARLGVVALADAIAKGEITSEDATEACIRRLETVGRRINCVIRIEADEALEAARARDRERHQGTLRGPLHGVPLAHKDLFFRAGRTVTCGAKITRDFVPDTTATALQRLEAAGAVQVAALHLAEFARSPTGHNDHFGPCRNPWDEARVTGGSSSGSGAAVAARLVPGSLGTDTGGSIRLPAAMCGVVGLVPTRTRVSAAGVMPLSWSMDTVGPLAREARDCARLLRVIAGRDAGDPLSSHEPVPDYEASLAANLKGRTIAVPDAWFYEPVTPEVKACLDASLAVLRDAGARVVTATPPNMALIDDVQHVVREVEAATVHARWLRDRPLDYADQVRVRTEPGLFYSAVRYCEALNLRAPILKEFLDAMLAKADLVHLPAVPVPVPTIAETTTGGAAAIAAVIRLIGHCTRHINYLGLPVIAVPCGFTPGPLPVAFQLVGRPFNEGLLLSAAAACQARTDWHTRAPAVAGV